MDTKNIKYATILALSTAIISGTNNFLTKIAVTAVNNPIAYTAIKNSIVGLLFIGLLIIAGKWSEVKKINSAQWLKLLAIGFVGGFIPFALFFTGLAKIPAINASLIHKTLFLWVFVLAIPFLKEKMSWPQWIGIVLIFAANLVVGGFQGFKYNSGELMILGATILWAVENVIAKVALKELSSLIVSAARMVIGSFLLIILMTWQGNVGLVSNLDARQWTWTLITSVLLFGYVLTWYSALKRAPATYVATLLVPATLVTNLLTAVFLTRSLSTQNVTSGLLYVFGAAIVIFFAFRVSRKGVVSKKQPLAFPGLQN